MEAGQDQSLTSRIKRFIIGGARRPTERGIFHRISLIAFFAWIGLGADGLSSSSYGPEEAFRSLGAHPHLAIFVALGTAITIFVISSSYSQIIELFPHGGGGYLVASKLLSPTFGMISGCALLVDYLLTVALSIASGADAIFSFLPASWYQYRVEFAVICLVALILLNMRGVKESVLTLAPIFITFVVTHAFAIAYAIGVHTADIPGVVADTAMDVKSTASQLGVFGMLVLILRAYSMGAGTYTGIEAVSNGLPILRDPKVETGKKTMRYMAISLAVTVFGLLTAYFLYKVVPQEGKTLNAVLLGEMVRGWNGDIGYIFVLITLVSEAALLFVAAQTGFVDGPRVLANMAIDRWVPTRFAMLSDRLVTQNGVIMIGAAAIILILATGGSVRFLVVLYSINVFITFCLSQLGMVRHWWQSRERVSHWHKKLLVNGVGLVLCSFILVSVTVVKFHDGGWVTLLVTGALIGIVLLVRRHYRRTGHLLKRLDTLVEAAEADARGGRLAVEPPFDPEGKTAVILVNGFNGLGLHTLFGVIRLFKGVFKNFVFVQVGVVDAGVFKGADKVRRLKVKVEEDVGRYIDYMKRHGFHAEGFTAVGVDAVDEVTNLAPQVLGKFPQAVFFGGQIVFPEEVIFSRWLHNYVVFAIQRRFYHRGVPFVILPIRV